MEYWAGSAVVRASKSMGQPSVEASHPSIARNLHQERGAVAVFVAVSMIGLLALAAFAIDFGRMYIAQAQLQVAADAAVLAAADELPNPGLAQVAAITYGNANDGGAGPIVGPGSVEVGNWDATTSTFQPGASPSNAVQVVARRSQASGNAVEMLFAGIVGVGDANVSAISIAARDVAADVVIVQDVTLSFLDEIPIAKDADKALVDAFAADYAAGVQLGVVSFARNSTVVAPLEFLTTSQSSTKSAIDSMANCTSAGSPGGPCYGTDLGIGIDRARQILVSQGRPNVDPVIVLVSDGVPCIGESSDPVGSGQVLATNAANQADAAGINIFVITLDQPTSSTHPCHTSDVTFNESLARGIGFGATTTDPDQLEILLTSIVADLPARLVK